MAHAGRFHFHENFIVTEIVMHIDLLIFEFGAWLMDHESIGEHLGLDLESTSLLMAGGVEKLTA